MSTYGEQRQERTKRRKREREENRGSAFRPGSNVASLLLFLPSSFFPEIARGERRGRERENTEVFSLFLLLLLASLYGSSSPYSYAEENLLRVWGGECRKRKRGVVKGDALYCSFSSQLTKASSFSWTGINFEAFDCLF